MTYYLLMSEYAYEVTTINNRNTINISGVNVITVNTKFIRRFIL